MATGNESPIAFVQEILDFAKHGPLLRPASPIEDRRFRVVQDFADAQEYAYHRTITDDEDAANWLDLREDQASQVLGPTYSNPALAAVLNQGTELLQPLAATLARLPTPYLEIVNDVEGDLRNCALSRAVLGPDAHFFDLLWDAYRQGGWPCGWEGEYPEGDLIVYEPPIERA